MPNRQPEVLSPNSKNTDWLSADELRTLTPEKIVARVAALSELIAANASEAERIGRPVDQVWSELRRAGIGYLYVPKKFGCQRLEPIVDILLPIAEGCASTAWCAMFTVEHQWLLAQFSEQLQNEVWNTLPYVTSAGSGFPLGKATRVEGGFRLSGQWKWASGIMHSEWAHVVGLVDEDGKKEPYFLWVPNDEVTILKTWHVDGMCGTGSNDIAIDDKFVPAHRATKFSGLVQGNAEHEEPIYRIPFGPFFALIIAVPVLGTARAALKHLRKKLATSGAGGKPSESQIAQAAIAKAGLDIEAAEMMIRSGARELQELAARDEIVSVEDRIRLPAKFAYGANVCRDATRAIGDLSGTSAHYLDNSMQRYVRDMNMMTSRALCEMNSSMELHGRIVIGLPSNNDWFK